MLTRYATRISYLLATLLLAPLDWGQEGPSLPSPEVLSDLDARIERHMASNNIPGSLVGVVADGKILWSKATGLADVELDVAVSLNSVFEIGSISKQFTAAITLMLIEEGRLGLDDAIDSHLEGLPGEWRGITIRQLLSHTSGIPDYEAILSYEIYRDRLLEEDVIRAAHSHPLDFLPGQAFRYSNTGYYLLSSLIESIEGAAFGTVLERRILSPLHMDATGMSHPDRIIKNRVKGYYQDRTWQLINRDATQPSASKGAGAMVSTLADLALWDKALNSTDLLSDDMKRLMWQPTVLPNGESTDYGYGWRVEPYNGHREQYHYGMTAGFIANITRLPDAGFTVIAFANRYREDLGRIVVPVMDAFLDAQDQ